MRKIIKRWGNSSVIILSKEDMDSYDFKDGDIIDIEPVKLKEDKNGNDA